MFTRLLHCPGFDDAFVNFCPCVLVPVGKRYSIVKGKDNGNILRIIINLQHDYSTKIDQQYWMTVAPCC